MTEVRVVYRKYGGALHWHQQGRLLGEDEHGVWVSSPSGTVARRGEEPPVVWDFDSVMLFPREVWWTASFNAAPHRTEIYCDITTVPEWSDGMVTMLDLDLDVLRRRSGQVYVDDEDEFAEHQVSLGYPADIIARAEESARWLLKAVGECSGPFGGAHEPWLALVS